MSKKQPRSAQLKAELNETDIRMSDLQSQVRDLGESVTTVTAAFARNEAQTEDVVTGRVRHEIAAESLKALETHREKLIGDITAAENVEAHDGLIGSMLSYAEKRRIGREAYEAAQKDLDAAASKMLREKEAFDLAGDEFATGLQKLVPGLTAWPLIPNAIRPQFAAAMNALGMTEQELALMLRRPTFPVLEHQAVITAAENHAMWAAADKRDRERLERVDRNNAERSRRQQEAMKQFEEGQRLLAVKQQRGWRALPTTA